jgi:ABC-type branched-subunit amino acid transport system permease subunit
MVGYTGQISLGHAGFFAIGAYGTVILIVKAGFPFLLALPCSALIAAGFGFLLGLPALRLEGPYLSIATLGFGLTITQIIGRIDLFGGREGLHAPDIVIGPWIIDEELLEIGADIHRKKPTCFLTTRPGLRFSGSSKNGWGLNGSGWPLRGSPHRSGGAAVFPGDRHESH